MQLEFDYREGEDLPFAALVRLREAGPVVWSENLQGWLVNSAACVRAVLGDVNRFTSAGTPVAEVFGGEAMLVNDTPMHHTMRAVWVKRVSRLAMDRRMEELRANAARQLEAVRPHLEAGEAVDFIQVFREYVMDFIASSFGVSRAHVDVFQHWSEMSADTPALGLPEDSPEYKRHFAVRDEVHGLLREQIADRKARMSRAEEPEDLTSLMVAAEGQNGITAQMVFDNLFNFILGALDTTEKWLGNIVIRLCEDAALRDQVTADRSLVEPLVDEVMRHATVAQTIQRRVREDGTQLGGQTLKAGDALYLMLGAANRDPAEFPDPDRFDLTRPAKANFGFGFGFHHCLGINIARAEAMAFVGALLDLLPPLTVARIDRGSSWALWGPRALEVRLATA
jgi:cytochrome P450